MTNLFWFLLGVGVGFAACILIVLAVLVATANRVGAI